MKGDEVSSWRASALLYLEGNGRHLPRSLPSCLARHSFGS
jgi:hypothetical protein